MADPKLKSLRSPDDVLRMDKIEERSVQMGEQTIGRAVAQPEPGEIMVSSMTREMVSGRGVVFEDRGTYELKGISGLRQLFAARLSADRR